MKNAETAQRFLDANNYPLELVEWGAGCPVDIRFAPTEVKRRPV